MSAEQMQEAVAGLVERLNEVEGFFVRIGGGAYSEFAATTRDAINSFASSQERIAQLEAEQDGLREALRQIAEAGTAHGMPSPDMVEAMRDIAKEALK